MKKYGLLLSGGVNRKWNAERYANDLGLAYETLNKALGYMRENICVLYADGYTINYLGNKIPTRKASVENIKNIFLSYQDKINDDDEFFFVVSNHGGEQKNGVIYLWGEKEYITLDSITQYLAQIPCRKMVILGQCYAGNILEWNHKNTIIVTANEKGLPSYSMFDIIEIKKFRKIFNYNYDEFLYHFFSYLQNTYCNAEDLTEIPDSVKIKQAFHFAYNQDRYNPKHIDYDKLCKKIGTNIYEVPQYKEYR